MVVRLEGRAVITEADLSAWSAAQGCYGEDAITSRNAAFMRLTEAALAESAMAGRGGPTLDEAAVSSEAARIDRETRAPDILACIKRALGTEPYLRVFVRPTLIESRLRLFLMQDKGVQAGPRGRMEEAVRRARKGEALEKAAGALDLTYSSATYSLETDTAAALSPGVRMLPPPDYQKDFIERYLNGLKPGELRGDLIESDYAFQAVRLLKADGPRRLFESAAARKAGQEEWFKSLPKMKLEISDEALRGWAKGLRGNPRLSVVEIP